MNLLLHITALTALAWLVLWLGRHWAADWQQRWIHCALLLLLLAPLMYLSPVSFNLQLASEAPDEQLVSSIKVSQRQFTPAQPADHELAAQPLMNDKPSSTTNLLIWLWLTGAVFTVWRQCREVLWLQRCRSAASPVADYRGLTVHSSADIEVPLLCAIGKTSILLPQHMESWPQVAREQVLAHEHCHHQHKDHWWLWLANLIRVMYWFHPLVHLLCQRHQTTTELACDQRMLSRGTDPLSYAQALVACVHPDQQRVFHSMASGSQHIKQRLSALTQRNRRQPGRSWYLLLLISGLLALGGCVNWQATQWVPASQLIIASQQDLPSIRNQNPPTEEVHLAVFYDGVDYGQAHVRLKIINQDQQAWVSIGPLQKFNQFIHTWHLQLTPGSYFNGEYEVIGVEPDGMVDGVAVGLISSSAEGELIALQSKGAPQGQVPNFICSWPLGLYDEEFIAVLPQLTADNPDSVRRLLCGAQLVGNGVHQLN
jgi:beta-lactamase regulating signal transducer with metallopeptidase domain